MTKLNVSVEGLLKGRIIAKRSQINKGPKTLDVNFGKFKEQEPEL